MNISVTLTPEFRLAQALKQAGVEDPTTVAELTVTGTLMYDDFRHIREYMRETLHILDMRNASIIERIDVFSIFSISNVEALIIEVDEEDEEYEWLFWEDLKTTKSTTSEECEKSCNECFEDSDTVTDENGVVFNKAKTALIEYPKERQGDYIIPNSVVRITKYAFADCEDLTSIIIPASVSKICEYAFKNCRGLTSITIPNSVEKIEYETFLGCSGLTSITIPVSVNGIIDTAFDGCTGLTAIKVHPDNPVYESENGVFFNKNKSKLLFCPKRLSGDYVIPDSVLEIREEAFKRCTALTSITIPASVTEIGKYAFKKCPAFITVHPENTAYKSVNGNKDVVKIRKKTNHDHR